MNVEKEEVENQQTTPVVESEAEGVKQEKTSEEKTDDGQKEDEKTPGWAKKRIGELTKEKWDARRQAQEAQRRADELEAQLAAARRQQPNEQQQGDEDTRGLSREEIDRLAEEKANAKLQIDRFNAKCDEVYNEGKQAFDDFDEVLGNFRDVGGLTTEFLQAVIETDVPHKVLYELGQDRDEAYRIMKLPPLKMAVALGKIAVAASTPKAAPVSKAPPPVNGVRKTGGARPPEQDPEKMTTEQWMKWRQQQLNAEKK